MYYFNIQDILGEHTELTSAQIFIIHKEKHGYVNRNSLGKALKKLVKQEIILVDKRSIEHKNGIFYFYSLKR